MKQLRGYIFSRPFMGERAPQHVQNIILRHYCEKNNYTFLLSSVEYKMNNSFYILELTIKELKKLDGIVAYSMFQLPESDTKRNEMITKILKQKKEIHFAVEDFKIKNKEDLKKLNEIWMIKKNLKDCPTKI
jgi:sporadic carbohydrate cluster protein (TIGR04323 family)